MISQLVSVLSIASMADARIQSFLGSGESMKEMKADLSTSVFPSEIAASVTKLTDLNAGRVKAPTKRLPTKKHQITEEEEKPQGAAEKNQEVLDRIKKQSGKGGMGGGMLAGMGAVKLRSTGATGNVNRSTAPAAKPAWMTSPLAGLRNTPRARPTASAEAARPTEAAQPTQKAAWKIELDSKSARKVLRNTNEIGPKAAPVSKAGDNAEECKKLNADYKNATKNVMKKVFKNQGHALNCKFEDEIED